MFRCQLCNRVAPAGVRANKVVVASRPRTYASRGGGNERGGFRGFRGRFRGPKPDFDKGGTGREIVQELSVCDDCAAQHTAEQKTAAAKAASETADVEESQ